MSEKRLVRATGQALCSPNTGLTGPRPTVHYPALHSRTDFFFFGPELGLYQHSLASQRSILEHVSIFSPSWDPHRFFFRAGARTATIGITHGRKTVSSSRNPCDSDPFLVATHNRCSSSWDPHRLLFSGRSLNGTTRVNATIGITHGRKTVSPSRNPCDSDRFLVATHNRCSPSWDPHRFFFRAGARTDSHQLGPTAERRLTADRTNQIFLYA